MKNKNLIYIIIFIGFAFSESVVGHDDRIIDILLSHDNQYYVTGSKDGKVIMWNNQNDKIESIFTIDSGKVITNIALSYDKHLLAIGFTDGTIDIVNISINVYGTIEIINIESKKTQTINSQDNKKIILLKFIDYKHLISCKKNDVIKLWDVPSPGRISEGDNRIILIKQFTMPSSRIVTAKINSNHKNILARLESGRIARWDIGVTDYISENKTNVISSKIERIKELDPPSRNWWNFDPYKYYNFHISADGSKIAIVTVENEIIIWNSNFAEKNIHIKSHNYRLNDFIFSNDGKYLASYSIDKTLKIWGVNRGDLITTYKLTSDWVTKAVFDNKTIICGTFKGEIKKYPIN